MAYTGKRSLLIRSGSGGGGGGGVGEGAPPGTRGSLGAENAELSKESEAMSRKIRELTERLADLNATTSGEMARTFELEAVRSEIDGTRRDDGGVVAELDSLRK